ncbi:ABC transporter permease [Candidatus Roseilinea sp. NK_OTU-006]|jgi:simple sugar transport system permease protein|uniref:ABC transporter permease n=1 Tax=Candidatus Roseilinea sp. NK_OTU-006 TaxID=2704250 RepID=UPI00145EA264|nr:ABC transporter permease [Candidatus Roseilinea sp. NK_OTU-006]
MQVKKLFAKQETLVALTLFGLCLVIGFINPVFWTAGNWFDLARSATVTGIFAIGVLIVLISGGIDVSFTAIAVFAMYTTTVLLKDAQYTGGMWLFFVIAALIGLGLGLINAFFIARFRLPTLIVTLGTQSMFRGFLLFVIGSKIIRDIPPGMADYSKAFLFTVTDDRGVTVGLHSAVLWLVAIAILAFVILRYTMLGRGIYALGGSREAAERAGFNIARTQVFIYAFVGVLAGIAGMIYGGLNRQANAQDIVGQELDVIAATVLGGASIMGGRGSVIGTLLGVMLVVVMSNSLVLMGIPATWQRVVVGAIIIIGTAVPALRTLRRQRRSVNVEPETLAPVGGRT